MPPPSNAASRAVRANHTPASATAQRSRGISSTTSSTSTPIVSIGTSTVPAKRNITGARAQSSQPASTKRQHPPSSSSSQASASTSRPPSVVRNTSQSHTTERSRSKTPVPLTSAVSRDRARRDREMSLDELAERLPSLPASHRRPVAANAVDRRRQVFEQIKLDLQRSETDRISIFPAIPDSPADPACLQRRLAGLVEGYLDPSIADFTSASFYAFLALTLFPDSIDARCLRAKCFLLAGQGAVFPLSPDRSSRGGATAALAVLEEGPVDVFGNVGCAQIWSEACKVLGRRDEAEEVLTWCLQNGSASASSQDSFAGEIPPQLVTFEDMKAAAGLTELGYMQKEAKQMGAATHHFLEARKRDPWNWRAWVGLCDLDTAKEAKEAFSAAQVKHVPSDFLEAVMQSLGGETYRKMIPEIEASLATPRTVAGVEKMKTHQAASGSASSASSQSLQRPGSRATASTGASTLDGASAKRSKAGPAPALLDNRPHFGPGRAAAAFGIETQGVEQQRSQAASAQPTKDSTMSRTLSQARTNERPLSSLSSGSRSTVSEKEKVPHVRDISPNVTRDSLRRSTRSAGADPSTGIRRAVSSKSNSRSTNGMRPIRAETKVSSAQPTTLLSRPRTEEQPSSEPDSAASMRRIGSSAQLLGPGPVPKKRPADEETDDAAQLLRVLTLKKAAENAAQWQATDCELLRYIELMAGAFKHARAFHGRMALDLLSSHQSSGITEDSLRLLKSSPEIGVLLGRVHHDMAQYVEAEQCFLAVLRHRPQTLEGMDIYSLVLFHLNRQERLSALAQALSGIDADAVETHIAIGNLFSLNASPSIALRSFRRACLSASSYAYSFTLAGHECLALNQPLKALRFFREAIRVDPRHWNGWSGIASILASEDRFDEARLAIKQACSLNRYNSGLWEVMGLLNEQKEDYDVALGAYSEALAHNPKSSSACLRRAELLWKTGKFEVAHAALLQVVALLPSEPRAHLLLAESYMRKGGGRFAPMAMSRSSGKGGPSANDPMNTKAKAVGEPKAPVKYQEEIARHLAIAVDLEPALNRRVKAMGEGVGATLRGQASGSGGPMSLLGMTGGHLMTGEVSVGSSFSGIDESRHPYSVEETGEEEEGSLEAQSYSYAPAAGGGGFDDSIGVLRDEQSGVSGDVDQPMSYEGSGSGSVASGADNEQMAEEEDGEDEENHDRSAETQQQHRQLGGAEGDRDEVIEEGENGQEDVEGGMDGASDRGVEAHFYNGSTVTAEGNESASREVDMSFT